MDFVDVQYSSFTVHQVILGSNWLEQVACDQEEFLSIKCSGCDDGQDDHNEAEKSTRKKQPVALGILE